DGAHQPMLRKQQGFPSFSPNGKYALFYDSKDWNTFSIPDGKVTNLTKNLGVPFGVEEYDSPSTPPPYGVAGWTKDDKSVLLYDRYDIWEIASDGSRARNLTETGRRDRVQFRVNRLSTGTSERGLDPDKPLLLRAENETTRDSGFYRLRLGSPPQLL